MHGRLEFEGSDQVREGQIVVHDKRQDIFLLMNQGLKRDEERGYEV